MKITARRRDDVLLKKSEHDDKIRKYDDASHAAYNEFRKEQRRRFSKLEDAIRSKLPSSDVLDIRCEKAFDGIECDVNYAEGKNFDEKFALVWRYTAKLTKSGDVKTETGSWSGLSATTPDQIKDLQKSVEILTVLTSLDWKSLLQVELPNYADHMKDLPERPERKDFSEELLQATIEDLIESGEYFKGVPGSGRNFRGPVWFRIIKETPTQVELEEVHDSQIEDYVANNKEGYTYKVKKSVFQRDMLPKQLEVYQAE